MATPYRTIQSSFASGLVSSMQEGAVGTSNYSMGLSVAENVFYGTTGCYRRYGTRFGTTAKTM